MKTPNHPPRVWVDISHPIRMVSGSKCFGSGDDVEGSEDPIYVPESSLLTAQSRIRELEEALETIVHTVRIEGCGYVDDRVTPRYFSPMSPQTIAAKALTAKGTK